MITYHLTLKLYESIKDRVPHADPIFYKESGVTCVKVLLDEDLFEDIVAKEGWR